MRKLRKAEDDCEAETERQNENLDQKVETAAEQIDSSELRKRGSYSRCNYNVVKDWSRAPVQEEVRLAPT